MTRAVAMARARAGAGYGVAFVQNLQVSNLTSFQSSKVSWMNFREL